ncbi:hypothetical protein B0H66DRAFT_572927 [Apodospora peruviana]|uniref:GDP/GTP exchange factor Sec2 N-terminal domain-containing protein n=1 Tax=Apodospora peruviana TaxID=516989 RepID=A0AAE0IUC2_9PEZI|nr:hypothetical protein B0H66DRAFT_572927 [Apodospora peruviana]
MAHSSIIILSEPEGALTRVCFVTVTGWSSHQMPPSGRITKGHNRSLSSIILRSASPSSSHSPPKSASSSESPTTAAEFAALNCYSPPPKRNFSAESIDDANDLSTLPDPRSRAMSPANGDAMDSPHHPDLDNEVATLSTKLINAINHQTTLDDTLSATKLELQQSRDKIRRLEKQIEEQRELLAGDVWVRRKTVELEKTHLLARVAEEKKAHLEVAQQKKKIEQELENLTTALFEEANKMVITAKEEARVEQEALQKKNDQLKAQIADTEGLLKSQQEQLAELKHVMEQMTAEKDDQSLPTVPSSPGFGKFDVLEEDKRPSDGVAFHHGALSELLSPSYPTSFTHLLQPVLRTDLAAYGDFKDLVRTSKRLSGQRISASSSTPALTSLGLGLGSVASQVSTANGSNSSLSTIGSPPATSPQTPNTPGSSVSAGSAVGVPLLPSLKETKFYKRVLVEDIEPTLRLDTAPGLSWLARRSVLTAVTEGSLVVEPVPATSTGRFGRIIKPELYPCALCGEARKDEEYLRSHRFRTSESGSAQSGYPLCKYCLIRVRSTCDFLGFLRIVKDGHWRAEDEDAEKAAWAESVRLREQMFWNRIGGGVVPTSLHQVNHASHSSVPPSLRGETSPRQSHEQTEGSRKATESAKESTNQSAELTGGPKEEDAQPPSSDKTQDIEQEAPSPPVSTNTTSTPLQTTTCSRKSEEQVAVHPLSVTIPAGSYSTV